MSLNTLLVCIIYLLLAPLAGGLLAGGEQILRCRIQKRKKGPDLLQPFRDVIGLLKLKPIIEGDVYFRCAAGYLVCMALTGCVVIAGGNFCLATVLAFAGYLALAAGHRFAGRSCEEELLRAIMVLLLFSLTAFGFYLVSGFSLGHGSFRISDLLASGEPPVRYLPGVVAALILYRIAGWQDPFVTQKMIGEYTGKVLALLETGRWIENLAFLPVLFLCHFAGSVVTGVVGVLVCLAVLILRVALTPLRFMLQDRIPTCGFAAICFLLCLGNFFVLLSY